MGIRGGKKTERFAEEGKYPALVSITLRRRIETKSGFDLSAAPTREAVW